MAHDGTLSVPVVDIGALMACKDDAQAAAALSGDGASGMRESIATLRAALVEWGFFYVSNHQIPPQHITAFEQQMVRFFALPKELKDSVRRSKDNPLGYYDDELTKNKKDWKEVFDFSPRYEDLPESERSATHNQWLDEQALPGFKNDLTVYYRDVLHVARRLLMLIAVTLGEEPYFFDQFFHEEDRTKSASPNAGNSSAMRLNHYPVAPDPEKTMGVYHHTDPGALTVLYQDDEVASLQVFHRATKQWQLIQPIKGTFVINIGDMIQVWSNDKYAAPLHRVLANGSQERYSSPLFHSPAFETIVRPVLVGANDTPRYRELNWTQYIIEKIAGNFADLGEEDAHISQYRIAAAADAD